MGEPRWWVDFAGDRGHGGPLTWCQETMWSALRWGGAHDYRGNLLAIWPVRAGIDLGDVLAAIRLLMERHETLRTTYECGPDGTPRQVVHAVGRLPVEAVDAPEPPTTAEAEGLSAGLLAARFDVARPWLLRIRAVVVAGRVCRLLVVASHLALDRWSLVLLGQQFHQLTAGPTTGRLPVRADILQPMDRMRFERSAAGRQIAQAGLTFWRQAVDRTPDVMIEGWQRVDDDDVESVVVRSTRMTRALVSLARRGAVGEIAVLLAAISVVLATICRSPVCLLRVHRTPRHRPGTEALLGTFFQSTAVVVPVGDDTFDHLLAVTAATLVNAARSSEHSAVALDRMLDDLAAQRALPALAYCYVNDIRFAHPQHSAQPAGSLDIDNRDGFPDQGAKFFLTFLRHQPHTEFHLTRDRRFMPGVAASALVRAIDHVIGRASGGPVGLAVLRDEVTEGLRSSAAGVFVR